MTNAIIPIRAVEPPLAFYLGYLSPGTSQSCPYSGWDERTEAWYTGRQLRFQDTTWGPIEVSRLKSVV